MIEGKRLNPMLVGRLVDTIKHQNHFIYLKFLVEKKRCLATSLLISFIFYE